jgi:hypothetical protein
MRFSDLLGMYLSVCSGRGTTPGTLLIWLPSVLWAEFWRERPDRG